MKKKTFVVSAVNLTSGGPLSILRECLQAAAASLPPEWDIVALVHNPSILVQPRVRFVAVPQTLGSWIRRLWFEWWTSAELSRTLDADVWLSLQDVSSRTDAQRQFVYCHNASSFYKASWKEARMGRVFFLQTLFYKPLYRVFLWRNHGVIVQQDWMRKEFHASFGKDLNVIVARPSIAPTAKSSSNDQMKMNVFLYPSLPRVFKNFEAIGEAAVILEKQGQTGQKFRFTISGEENSYARDLYRRYSTTEGVQFIGNQTYEGMKKEYETADVVIFPSKLESWGLPISEAKGFGKTLFLADLPYAHETVGDYEKVAFFPATDPETLADLITRHMKGLTTTTAVFHEKPDAPFSENWDDLFQLMTKDL
jgi:glycosyltransferase involved in cell wall biosynthesis